MSNPFLDALKELEIFGGQNERGEIQQALIEGQTAQQRQDTLDFLRSQGHENPEEALRQLEQSGVSSATLVPLGPELGEVTMPSGSASQSASAQTGQRGPLGGAKGQLFMRLSTSTILVHSPKIMP